jgi:carbonic anhydrase
MPVLDEILAANERYAGSFGKGELAMPPSRRFAVVTCMDARIDPAKALGLEEGDAHVIRNAGGLVTEDALRSLAISHWLLGTEEFVVIGHTDCGMLTFTNEDVRGKIGAAGADAEVEAHAIDFRPFGDLDDAVRRSVRTVQKSDLFPEGVSVTGFVYDVRSGRLREVAA